MRARGAGPHPVVSTLPETRSKPDGTINSLLHRRNRKARNWFELYGLLQRRNEYGLEMFQEILELAAVFAVTGKLRLWRG